MTAGRCPECGVITIKDRRGAWILRHEPGCLAANPGNLRRDELDLWPKWERTCPACGRYHNRFRDHGDAWVCTFCHWEGRLPVTRGSEDRERWGGVDHPNES